MEKRIMVLSCPHCKDNKEQEANVVYQKDVASHISFTVCGHTVFSPMMIRDTMQKSEHPEEEIVLESYNTDTINQDIFYGKK